MPMSDPISAWHTEHVYFGHLLDLLSKELDAFHSGARPNYELAHDIVTYLRDYADQYHHPREDKAFELLAQRCPDMELFLARLRQQHRVIADSGEGLLRHIEAILEDAIVPRAQLETSLAIYLAYYRNHIAEEEESVLERAATVLAEADWDAVRNVPPLGGEPVLGAKSEEQFRELRRRIAIQA